MDDGLFASAMLWFHVAVCDLGVKPLWKRKFHSRTEVRGTRYRTRVRDLVIPGWGRRKGPPPVSSPPSMVETPIR